MMKALACGKRSASSTGKVDGLRAYSTNKKQKLSIKIDNDSSIERFRSFLKIRSISGNLKEYQQCVDFLTPLLQWAGLETRVSEVVKGKPILVCTWLGSRPELQSILLNSHYDVVKADDAHWTTWLGKDGEKKLGPWEAFLHEPSGNIYGRGTQDMKCVCMQYVEAIIRLKLINFKPVRTIHLSFMPDEEVGGHDGMCKFIASDLPRQLNIGVALDEGLAHEGSSKGVIQPHQRLINGLAVTDESTLEAQKATDTDVYTIFHGERAGWWIRVHATGPAGHGSRFVENTANAKLITCVQRFLDFRKQQENKWKGIKDDDKQNRSSSKKCDDDSEIGCRHAVAMRLGDVASVNLTVLQAGVPTVDGKSFMYNVIPTYAMAGFDIRLPVTIDLEEFERMLKEWTKEDGLTYDFVAKVPKHFVSGIDPATNPWWNVILASAEETKKNNGKKPADFTHRKSALNIGAEAGVPDVPHSYALEPEIFPAGTDGRYLRALGIPVYGFSPMANTPCLLHDHNEFINKSTYLKGISVYERLIFNMSNALHADDTKITMEHVDDGRG